MFKVSLHNEDSQAPDWTDNTLKWSCTILQVVHTEVLCENRPKLVTFHRVDRLVGLFCYFC